MAYFSEEQKDTYVRLRFRAIIESLQKKREPLEFMADPQSEEVKERPITIKDIDARLKILESLNMLPQNQ